MNKIINFIQIPNNITFARIIIIPVIVILLMFDNSILNCIGALFFTLASISDIIDGYLARKFKKVSPRGKLLDPLADKLLLLSALIMLIPLGRIPAWLVVILICREMTVTGIRGVAASRGIVIPASRLGKYKTSFLDIGTIGLMLGTDFGLFGLNWEAIGTVILLLGTFFSLISAYDYIRRTIVSDVL